MFSEASVILFTGVGDGLPTGGGFAYQGGLPTWGGVCLLRGFDYQGCLPTRPSAYWGSQGSDIQWWPLQQSVRILLDCTLVPANNLNNITLFQIYIFAGFPPDISKRASPEFSKAFIKVYLERLAELEGKSKSSVTEREVEQYFVWTSKCALVSTCFFFLS